jgi:non-specific serine/threonine protein kinase/serine/threonine-protein kinase
MVRQPSRSEWSHIQALFAELIDLDPAAQEHRLAAEDDFISGQLRALLAASRHSGILDGAAPSSFETAPRRAYSSLSEGAVIGGFTIDRLIGRGGMGEVYAAHRSDRMFDQQVAIKLLRPESVAHSELFDRERRLLAGLEHPGIARLIDGGVAPDGRPYMAMEYVTGEPIDAWCRTHDADLATRLRLFCDVCEAVAYAHSHLIVHRDLKPSNILVDSDGRARLLDFGIARLVEIEGESEALTTIALMTPDYAAPEQLGNAAPTVATDVYALGVLLFELLTGRSPWREPGSALPSVIRRILNDDPPLPSALVPPGYPFGRREVAGDLDAIVLKAMRRAPQDRYRGVGELVDDVRSHMALRPVAARSGSAGYTIGRYLRRHRVATAAAGAALLAVMFRDTASSAVGEEATVKQMLDQTAAQLVASVDRSAKSATLITTLADLYVNLEDAAGADALLSQALARGIGAGDPVATAEIKLRLASTAAAMGRTDDMAPLLDSADAVFAADPARFRKERLESMSGRAQLARRKGDYDTAIRLLQSSLPDADRVYAEDHRELLTRYNNLLVYMVEANRLDAMPAVFAAADAALARTGQQGSAQGLAIEQLKGVRLMKLDRLAEAERLFRGVADRRRAVFGKSAALAVDLLQLGRAELALGKFAAARDVLGEARPMAIDNLGPDAVPTLVITLGLAEALAEADDTGRAEALLAEAAPRIAAMGPVGLPQGIAARTRAIIRLKQGRTAEARREADRSEQIFRTLGAPGESYLKSFAALRRRLAA